jgi:hypothetical protein
LGADKTIATGEAITLDVSSSQAGVSFKIDYDSATKPSKIEFTTSTFIEMTSLKVYNAPYPGGSIITSTQGGNVVYLRAVVTDPFGAYDITSVSIDNQATPVSATAVATTSCTKTYEYALFTPSIAGSYTYTATAKEGFENTVTDSEYLNLTVTTPKIDFDGSDDHIDFGNVHNLTSSFSLEAWVLQEVNVTNGTIISKGNTKAGNKRGYLLSLINKYPNITWYNGTGTALVNLTSPHPLTNNKWYHIASTFDGATAKLYIDGLKVNEVAILTAPLSGTEPFILGAIYDSDTPNTPKNYFNGFIDEVRIWNVALTAQQIREMMNQEIEQNGTAVRGKEIPLAISGGLLWSNLKGYYPMDDNTTDDKSGNTIYGNKKNITTTQIQSAPLPYVSVDVNLVPAINWDVSTTWINGSVQNIPNSVGIDALTPIDWNIVQTKDNLFSNRNLKLLGLKTSSETLTINADHSLEITKYLKLDGKIDLEGESQLAQGLGSVLDATSSGKLERDQQGTKDLYTYNYWSSPVGFSNTTSNNNSYKLTDNIIKNGTIPASPNNITFLTSGYNGSVSGTNISIADYWIWKYANATSGNYYGWQHVRQAGTILAGQGFTMKGVESSGSSFSATQNYTFYGKPNNGDIILTLSAGNDYLVGNPYPTAIDANAFIKDNISTTDGGNNTVNVINGTLYFWEHFASGSHILREYQGGYGTYTLMGGAAAVTTDALINTGGSLVSTKGAPKRYIPVSQGFFVSSVLDANLIGAPNDPGITQPVVGGNIIFKNSQRIFKTEATDPSVFYKTSNNKSKVNSSQINPDIDLREKIRLKLDSPKGYHRSILAGVDTNASNGFDLGYDAPLIEDNLEDMFWVFSNNKFVIQGVGNFDADQKLPLGVKINQTGLASIKIDALENIPNSMNILLLDKESNIYHDLKQSNFEVYLDAGQYLDRFEITFSKAVALNTDDFENTSLQVYFSNEKESIIIHNPEVKNIESTEIFNLLGQSIYRFDSISNENYMEYKTKYLSAGTYIIKLKTDSSIVSKKVLIK